MKKHLLIVACCMLCIPCLTSAAEIGGATLPDSMTADGETLMLNGAGLRKKFFVKVYAGGLYLKQKMSDPGRIIAADEPMAVRMHWIHDGVSTDKIIGGWNEGFEKNTKDLGPLQERINRFNGFFTQEAKADDVYDFIYLPGKGVQVLLKGKAAGTVAGLDFKKALFAIWFGESPADAGLKEGMIGK